MVERETTVGQGFVDVAQQRGTDLAQGRDLEPLLRPRSIAFIGASRRPDTPGNTMLRAARIDGYDGLLYAINPHHTEVEGIPCYPDLASLPSQVDHAVIGVRDSLVEQALGEAIEHGARAATIFSSCDLSHEGDDMLASRLTALANEAGLALCGGNSMGFLNPGVGVRVTGFPYPVPLLPGGVALITQSGSVFSALAYNDRRIRFALCVSTGREMTTRAEDYLDWSLAQPETKVVGLFLETARDPARFVAAMEKADRQGIPVVVLKVGRTETSARFAVSHSGAVAGNMAVYEALFHRHNVIAVDTIDQLAANLLLLSSVAMPPSGSLASMHDSGGEREMVADLADRESVPFATLSVETRQRIAAHLDSGLKPENPLDVWGSGRDFEVKVKACMTAMLDDPATAIGVLFQDIRDGSYIAEGFTRAVIDAAHASTKPVAVVTNYASVNHRQLAQAVTEAGVPVIDGTEEGLRAIAALLRWRDRRLASHSRPAAIATERREYWRHRLQQPAPVREAEAMTLLSDYGIDTPRLAVVSDLAGAIEAAERIGYCVALKTAAPEIDHKTDVGGVMLGIAESGALEQAYRRMAGTLGPHVIVASQVPSGVEIAFGLLHDAQFGSYVLIAAGGVWIEALADRAVALPGLSIEQARALIDNLAIAPRLRGGRGQQPADVETLARAFARFAMLAEDLGDLIAEMDVNPLLVSEHGCFAVDALVVTRASRGRPAGMEVMHGL